MPIFSICTGGIHLLYSGQLLTFQKLGASYMRPQKRVWVPLEVGFVTEWRLFPAPFILLKLHELHNTVLYQFFFPRRSFAGGTELKCVTVLSQHSKLQHQAWKWPLLFQIYSKPGLSLLYKITVIHSVTMYVVILTLWCNKNVFPLLRQLRDCSCGFLEHFIKSG